MTDFTRYEETTSDGDSVIVIRSEAEGIEAICHPEDGSIIEVLELRGSSWYQTSFDDLSDWQQEQINELR